MQVGRRSEIDLHHLALGGAEAGDVIVLDSAVETSVAVSA